MTLISSQFNFKNFNSFLLVIFTICSISILIPSQAAFCQNEALVQSSVDEAAIDRCQKLFNNSVRPYQELQAFLPRNFPFSARNPTHWLLKMKIQDCAHNPNMRSQIEKGVGFHSEKIGIALPFSRWSRLKTESIIRQIQNLAIHKGIDPQQKIVWVDTGFDNQQLQGALAQLVFRHQASVIISGLSQAEVPLLSSWSERLHLPSIILNHKSSDPKPRFSFYVSPDHKNLAAGLLRQMKSRALPHVAVLLPRNSKDGFLLEKFFQQAKSFGVQVAGPFSYDPTDFGTIDPLLRKILHLDDPERQPELLELIEQLKQKAKDEGASFELRQAVLPPIVDVDAILIADHFKNVKHISRALHANGVRRIPLFGIPRWRALELVSPPDEILYGSQFVDYVGAYNNLPYQIEASFVMPPYIVEGLDAGLIDVKLLLSHAFYAAQSALKGPPIARYNMVPRLEAAQVGDINFFGSTNIFKGDHTSYWPSFIFSVEEAGINLTQVWNPKAS